MGVLKGEEVDGGENDGENQVRSIAFRLQMSTKRLFRFSS